MNDKRYLGDSVYAEYDGHVLVLTTENGASVTNRIELVSDVYDALVRYVDHMTKGELPQ